MGKSAPSAPPAPDPAATAAAQSGVNKDTAMTQAALNRINQVTPQGTLTYSHSPALQIQDDPNNIGGFIVDGQHFGHRAEAEQYANINAPWVATTALSPEQQTLYNLQTQGQTALGDLGVGQLGRIQNAVAQPFSYAGMPSAVNSLDAASQGQLTSSANGGPFNIQGSFTPGSLAALAPLMSTADMNQALQTADQARLARLNPQFDLRRSQLETQLANQGIAAGSQAYNDAYLPFNQQISDAENAALTASTGDLATLFGISLSGRQQGVSEQNQAYQQALGLADLNNQAQAQAYGQNFSNAQLGNAAQLQAFNEQQAAGDFQNQARARSIQEAAYLRNQPLSEFSAFMSGSQPTMPTFQSTPMTQVQGTDLTGPVYAGYQGALNNYNQNLGQQNATTGGLFGLGGSALGGWAMNGFGLPTWI